MRKLYTSLLALGMLTMFNASAQFPAPYCAEAFSDAVEPITNVTFAGINNTTAATTGGTAHEDFTAMTGTVRQGQSYSVSLQGNSDGNYANFYTVFFDFNGDNDFTDANERFNINYIINSTGVDGKTATGTITIPFGANTGSVRMRVVKKYAGSISYPNTCNTTGYGQAEDYTVTILAAHPTDASVLKVYALGKNLAGEAQVVTARVRNSGTSTLTNLPVTLTVSGATTFTSTKNVTINSGDSATVTFDAFSSPAGTATITVSVPADNEVANNSMAITQTVTAKTVSTAITATPDGGVGNNSAFSMAIRFANTTAKTIDQLLLYFPATSTGQPFTVAIHDASGTGGTPGAAALWTSGALTTNGANQTIAVPNVAVTASDFFVVINQTGTTNMGYGYETENPLRQDVFYLKTTGDWTDFADLALTFKLMADVRFDQGTMPVTLVAFSGEKTGESNKLSWSTATESNNKGFDLERSADGKNFSSIGFVATKAEGGNSGSTLNYVANDERILKGTNYYRLKQIDKDGRFAYSSIVVLTRDVKDIIVSSVYPNPAKGSVNLIVSSPVNSRTAITVTDLTGKVVKQVSSALVMGDNNITLNISDLAAGTYYVRITSGDETVLTRFVKNYISYQF